MKPILIMLCAAAALAQNPNTAIFPTGIATDSDLLVANDNAQSVLTGGLTSTATSVILSDASRFVPPVAITVDSERMKCTSRSGNTLTCIRGQYGSTAVAHGSKAKVYGYIIAWHHNQVAAEQKALETWAKSLNLNPESDGTLSALKGFALSTPTAATYNVGGTTTLDFSKGPISLAITGDTTLAFQNVHGFGPLYILATQDGTGHASPFTYPGNVLGAPQPVATASKTTLIACVYDASTNLFCSALATDDTNSYFPDTVIYVPGHVADLPTCTMTLKGGKRVVDDATAPTFLGTVSGSGSVVVPVLCNGTAWVAY